MDAFCILTTAHPVDDVRVNSRIAASFVDLGFQVLWVGPGHAYFSETVRGDSRIQYHLTPPIKSRLDRLRSYRRVSKIAHELSSIDWWYSPDPDAAVLAQKVARRRGGRTIFDIHEVFHGALLDRWLLGQRATLIREYVRRRIQQTCRKADRRTL